LAHLGGRLVRTLFDTGLVDADVEAAFALLGARLPA
jgi:hypothetical protein